MYDKGDGDFALIAGLLIGGTYALGLLVTYGLDQVLPRTCTPVKADRGKRIRVVVQAVRDYYAPGQVTTPKTHRVAPR